MRILQQLFGTDTMKTQHTVAATLAWHLGALALLSFVSVSVFPILAAESLVSPDGAVKAVFDLRDGQPVFSLTYKETAVLALSPLGLNLKDAFRGGFESVHTARGSASTEWKPVWGERALIPD